MQNAVYDKLFGLPETFFRRFESADLAQRAMEAGGIASSLVSVSSGIIVTVINVIVYTSMMCRYSGNMAGIAIISFIVYAAIMIIIYNLRRKYKKKVLEIVNKFNDIVSFYVMRKDN